MLPRCFRGRINLVGSIAGSLEIRSIRFASFPLPRNFPFFLFFFFFIFHKRSIPRYSRLLSASVDFLRFTDRSGEISNGFFLQLPSRLLAIHFPRDGDTKNGQRGREIARKRAESGDGNYFQIQRSSIPDNDNEDE